MALAMSVEEGPIGTSAPSDEGGVEFNAYTLFGPYQPIFTNLLRFVEQETASESDAFIALLRAHIERGVRQLAVRIKTPVDASTLLGGG
jgi:DNA sulfur modification protein DndE